MSDEPTYPQFSPLIADIITAQFDLTRQATDRVIEHLRYQLADEQARRRLIVAHVRDAYDKPWIPQPSTVLDCLFPPEEDVQALREEILAGEDN